MSDITIFNDNLEKYFSLLLDQCSPSMEQSLAGGKKYEKIKENYDIIELIKLIERICYNYQLHKFTPLGGWDLLDRLASTLQFK